MLGLFGLSNTFAVVMLLEGQCSRDSRETRWFKSWELDHSNLYTFASPREPTDFTLLQSLLPLKQRRNIQVYIYWWTRCHLCHRWYHRRGYEIVTKQWVQHISLYSFTLRKNKVMKYSHVAGRGWVAWHGFRRQVIIGVGAVEERLTPLTVREIGL